MGFKKLFLKCFLAFLYTTFSAMLISCAGGKNLKSETAKNSDIQGNYTLILYGGGHSNDIGTVAILDKEGDQYTIVPFAPEFNYKVKKGMSAKEALDKAEEFVGWHNAFYMSSLRRIIGDRGDTIGYELRPLYLPFVFGVSDVLDISYRSKNGNVMVIIRLDPSVERMLQGGDTLKD